MWVLIFLLLFGCILLYFIREFVLQIILLGFSIMPFVLWFMFAKDTSAYVPIFAMEKCLLSGTEDSYHNAEITMLIFVVVYICVAILSQISQWTLSASYGCVASIAFSSIIAFVDLMTPESQFSKPIVFVATFVITLLFMRKGFHSHFMWIMPNRKILSLAVGIIPALIFSFISLCNIITFTFGEAVVGKVGFVVLAILLEVVLYGVGIFLYFRFENKYWEIMAKKIERLEEKGA